MVRAQGTRQGAQSVGRRAKGVFIHNQHRNSFTGQKRQVMALGILNNNEPYMLQYILNYALYL